MNHSLNFWFLLETQQLLYPSLENLHKLCVSHCAQVWPDGLAHRPNKMVAIGDILSDNSENSALRLQLSSGQAHEFVCERVHVNDGSHFKYLM